MDRINMFLVKYAEIGTKGKNRYVFEEILCKRIRNRIKSLGEFDVRRDFGRIYVEALSDYDYDTCLDYLTKIFGIEQEEAHRAYCDAEANVGVYFKLKELSNS